MSARAMSRLAKVGLTLLAAGCHEEGSPSVPTAPIAAQVSSIRDAPRAPKTVRFPAPEYATLQDAVNAVADDGTIFIGPGVHKANVDVVGKSVRFFGERHATTIVAGDPSRSVFRFSAGGGGEVRELTIQGGTAAIEGYAKLGSLRALMIRRVIASGALNGVAGQFEDLEIIESRFEKLAGTAIHIQEFVRLLLSSAFVADARCFGLLVINRNPRAASITVRNSSFDRNGCGGIGIWGDAAPIVIDGVGTHANTIGGIILVETGQSTLTQFATSNTRQGADGKWGDGIIIWGGTAVLSRGFTYENDRAGVSIFHCADIGLHADVTIGRTSMFRNAFDMDLGRTPVTCEASSYQLTDAGHNICDGVPNSCSVSSARIEPTPPPD